MNYIITKNKWWFDKIGEYNFCDLDILKRLPDKIAIDTETTSLFPRLGNLFCIQIGTGKNNFIIDLQQIGDERYLPEDVFKYLDNKRLVGHNLTFDLGWFYKHGFFPDNLDDTFIASKILNNGKTNIFSHSFGNVMSRELGIEYDKSEQKNIAKIQLGNKKTIEYSFNDVDKLLELNDVLNKKLDEGGYLPSYDLHREYITALAYMEQCGLPTSKKSWKSKMNSDLIELEDKEAIVKHYIYDHLPSFRDNQLDLFSTNKNISVVLSSPKQMLEVFKAFKINCVDKDGKPSINEAVINKTEHDFVKLWLNFQSAKHDITTYGSNIYNRIEDDYIYTTFNPILDTARISTRREGINVLNFPSNKKTRECFEAHDGFKMIVADYEGQENVVGADMHQDKTMVASLKEGLDLHCAFARLIFPQLTNFNDSVIMKEHKDKRNYSKAPRFLFSYGGNAYTLTVNNNIPIEETTRLETLYKQLHEGIYTWGGKVLEEALKVGYIESADGFKLHLPYYDEFKELKIWFDDLDRKFWDNYKRGKILHNSNNVNLTERDQEFIKFFLTNRDKVSKFAKHRAQYFKLCLNNPIQTTAAHQTKRAAVMLFKHIKERGHLWKARIANIPHDEFVLEVKDELVEEYKQVLADCMIKGGNYYLKNNIVFMKAEANSGLTWDEAK